MFGFDFDSVGVGGKRGVWLDVARGVSLLYGEVDLVSISCVGVSICDSVARSAWVSSFVIWWVGGVGQFGLCVGEWGVRDGSSDVSLRFS